MAIFEIQPNSNFPISRLLPNLGDNVTYYVQAIIQNATTGATIKTVNLTSYPNRLWSGVWRVIADSVGLGLFVVITTIAYTDSGYTQASPNYYPESNTYLIFDRYNYVAQLSTQVGAQISIPETDYKKIAQIILKAVKGIEFPDYPVTDWTPHLDALHGALKEGLAGIKMPDPADYPQTDLTPVHEAINASEARIHDRISNIPPQKETDLSPILEALKSADMKETMGKVKDAHASISELKSRMDTTMPELGKYLDGIILHMKDFLYMVSQKEARQPQEEKTPKLIQVKDRLGNTRP